jgi:hypothetical protein
MPTPLPTLPGVYYLHLSATAGGLPTGNIFTFKATTLPGSAVEDQTWAQLIADQAPLAWNSTVLPELSNTIHGTSSRVYGLGHPTNPAALGFAAGSGAVAANLAPVSAAAIIRHNVLRRGRGSQSHSSISPLANNTVTTDGTSITGAFQGVLQTEFENFIGVLQAAFTAGTPGNNIDYVQLSKKGAGATYPITGSATELLLGTERSRTPRP